MMIIITGNSPGAEAEAPSVAFSVTDKQEIFISYFLFWCCISENCEAAVVRQSKVLQIFKMLRIKKKDSKV